MKNELAVDLVNVGIGSFRALEEVYQKAIGELNNAKSNFLSSFDSFRERGELDVTNPSLSLKVNTAWALVRFKDARETIAEYITAKTKK